MQTVVAAGEDSGVRQMMHWSADVFAMREREGGGGGGKGAGPLTLDLVRSSVRAGERAQQARDGRRCARGFITCRTPRVDKRVGAPGDRDLSSEGPKKKEGAPDPPVVRHPFVT